MRREPPITFRGALQLLGVYERPLVDRLDRLLGGVILGAGALAAVPALAPLAPIWGWVDQKSEATGLLRTCLDRVQSRLSEVRGYERVELVAAAHTTIVVSAVFEAVREAFTADVFAALEITAAEREMLAAGRWRGPDEPLLTMLWASDVPCPTGASGFAETETAVRGWAYDLTHRILDFVDGLEGGSEAILTHAGSLEPARLAGAAVERYRTHYLRLAATVPDFWIWAQLGEQAATRAALRDEADSVRADVRSALSGSHAALSRIESLLATMVAATTGPSRQREALARANRDVLGRPVVRWPVHEDRFEAITFPTVEESYINPAYRLAVADRTGRPADEAWWAGRPVRHDLDLMITTLVTTYDGTRRPLVLLGHPGGGKSMLTKVLAARLPAESYTVVRVPLRQVVANAPIHQQIRQALDLSTHGRATDWSELADDDPPTVRIVLLDGLDELLQATTHDRSGFLTEVMEFQRVEAAQERPVMVVVSSRTVVAERVDIPPGTPIAKLEEFDEEQIGQWLAVWNRANAAAGDRVRPVTGEAALAHPELARQPLLLLMLAIYWSDPEQTIDGELTLSGLYQRLLTNFAVREVRKKAGTHLRGPALDEAVAEQLYRLSIAAIGMFNRGRQDITESELGADLHGLDPDGGTAVDAESAGQRVLGEFFFIHAAEAQVRVEQREVRRCYEFLHATFGEYLIASLVVETLADVADTTFGGARGRRRPTDDFLFALLTHQTLASRQPILEFAGELLRDVPGRTREHIARTLELLIQGYDRRTDTRRYPRYRPLPETNLRPIAAYSANLILLRGLLDDQVPLSALCLEHEQPITRWRATVNLWRAGLDADGWQAMLDSLSLGEDAVRLNVSGAYPPEFSDILYTRLLGDPVAAIQQRLGAALHRKVLYYVEGDRWAEMMASWLLPAIALPAADRPGFILAAPPPGTPQQDVEIVVALMSDAMVWRARFWSPDFLRLLVAWLARTGLLFQVKPIALATALVAQPALLDEFPSLREPRLYDDAARLLLWLVVDPASGDRRADLLGHSALEFSDTMKAHVDNLIQRATLPVGATPFSTSDGYSIVTSREGDEDSFSPIPAGSVNGSLAEGQGLDPDLPLPQLFMQAARASRGGAGLPSSREGNKRQAEIDDLVGGCRPGGDELVKPRPLAVEQRAVRAGLVDQIPRRLVVPREEGRVGRRVGPSALREHLVGGARRRGQAVLLDLPPQPCLLALGRLDNFEDVAQPVAGHIPIRRPPLLQRQPKLPFPDPLPPWLQIVPLDHRSHPYLPHAIDHQGRRIPRAGPRQTGPGTRRRNDRVV
jgi:hypothetical protein